MYCGGVRQNRLDISKIDADRHRAGPLQRALFSEFDQSLSIKLWKTKMPKSFVQEDEAGSFGTTDVLADLCQILTMKRNEITEELDVAGFVRRCRFLAIDPPLDIDLPSSASFRRRNVSLTYFPFRRTWALQDPDFSLVIDATRVRSVCTEASKSRKKRGAMA